MENSNRVEAERLLGIAEKLLHNRDFTGSKDFAILAQETEPLLDGSDQILAVADVLLASEKQINNHNDWYSILQIERRSDDSDLIKKQYRKLALLLHPDKNKFPFADQAFKLVADSWAVLSDNTKKSLYDNELNLYAKIDLSHQDKLPVRRSQRSGGKKQQEFESNDSANADDDQSPNQRLKLLSFWTACPYCYVLFEYPRVYEGCCLRCQNCKRAFQAVLLPSLPPLVQGQEAYYCCWGFFPMGFAAQHNEKSGKGSETAPPTTSFPNWMPPIFSNKPQETSRNGETAAPVAAEPTRTGREGVVVDAPPIVRAPIVRGTGTGKKRGRPRKNPIAA
ncbi:uncharacterized protein LOC101205646 [Cucumis sativus]|uniref:J domain-containing protein n=1 Tax=Cucumis sativus TaxID=3659 RepID=A0A0A0LEP7_CUCSA|nr:uncharacterized protein LOC101205646 [Cucumis sativus]KGN60258.1 hypothetical protein Csa_001742 [Cucumis sativus]